MRQILGALYLLICFAVIPFAHGQKPPQPKMAGWKEFISKEGGFSILLPGTPVQKKETMKSGDGKEIILHIFNLELKNKAVPYYFDYYDYPDGMLQGKNAAEDNLKQLKEATLHGKTKIADKEIKLADTHPGFEISFQIKKKDQPFERRRVFLVNNRLFQIVAASNTKEGLASKEVEAYFESFKLLDK